jgi:hypothetical protein
MRLASPSLASLVVALTLPASALACGGFFCNAQTPVNQAAERILFAVDGDQTVMHVRVDYQGPPLDFGWILPMPRGVETALSSETLFQGLDVAFGPQFFLNYESEEGCDFNFPTPEASAAADAGVGPGGVTVVSRENVGPYDRAILEADSVMALRAWLDENQFAIPGEFDARLEPYIEAQAVFVVIKLLPGLDAGEIVPLKMSFPGTTPSVPIVPTAVAANPDLGVIVHVLGAERAIPLNYRHVIINEATIDWQSGGQNYADVVSQAADEAGGHAFTTDFSGPIADLGFVLPVVSAEAIASLAAVRDLQGLDAHLCNFGSDYRFLNDRDANRIFASVDGLSDYLQTSGICSFESAGVPNTPVDGGALAAQVTAEINDVRVDLNALLARQAWMTRLYTTMSPAEMDRDPVFDFNPDLPPVSNQHNATAKIKCGEDGNPILDRFELVTSTGVVVQVGPEGNPMAIRRRDGMTVQQGALPAAAVVERLKTSGPPELIDEPMGPVGGSGGGGGGGGDPGFDAGAGGRTPSGTATDDDDGCTARPGQNGGAFGVLGVALIALLSRRRTRRA